MEKYINGTLAARAENAAGWGLRKTGGQENIVSYELRTHGAHKEEAADVALHVINGLLDGMQVGVIAESGEAGMPALTKLGSVWRDGRLLKRGQGSAFVAMESNFDRLSRCGVEPCVGAGAAFRFLGFESSAPADRVFRSLLEPDDDAVIELRCPDLAGGVLNIRLDAEKIDESKALGGISAALGDCGQSLQVEM